MTSSRQQDKYIKY